MAILRSKRGSLGAIVALVSVSAGCGEEIVDLQGDLYAVHGVLVTGAQGFRLRVTRNDPRLQLGEEPVNGVVITPVTGRDTLAVLEEAGSASGGGWYAITVPGGISPGDTFELLIILPSGRASASTIALSSPAFISPIGPLRIHLMDSLRLPVDIAAPPRAAGASLFIRTDAVYVAEGQFLEGVCAFPSGEHLDVPPRGAAELTSFLLRKPSSCFDPTSGRQLSWDSVDVRLGVTVFDSAYVQYAQTLFDADGAYRPHASSGVSGALGLFASAAEAFVNVRILRAD